MLASLAIWLVDLDRHDAAASAPDAATTHPGSSMPGMVMPAAAHRAFPAKLPPLAAGRIHHYTFTLNDASFDVAPGVRYNGWTFDGAAPGPVIHVRPDRLRLKGCRRS